jgi:hypothetical protein
MKYSFYDAAVEEFFAAIDYYEGHEPGLGLKFSEEIYAAIKRICDHPYAWTMMDLRFKHQVLPGK